MLRNLYKKLVKLLSTENMTILLNFQYCLQILRFLQKIRVRQYGSRTDLVLNRVVLYCTLIAESAQGLQLIVDVVKSESLKRGLK